MSSAIGAILSWIFSYILYPVMILLIFVFVGGALFIVIEDGEGTTNRIRRVVGAALPWLVLIFLVTISEEYKEPLGTLWNKVDWQWQFLIGSSIGVFLIEFGRVMTTRDDEVSASLYSLFLSSILSFIVLLLMGGVLQRFNIILLGFVVGGGMDIVLRSMPIIVPSNINTEKDQ